VSFPFIQKKIDRPIATTARTIDAIAAARLNASTTDRPGGGCVGIGTMISEPAALRSAGFDQLATQIQG